MKTIYKLNLAAQILNINSRRTGSRFNPHTYRALPTLPKLTSAVSKSINRIS